MAAPACRRAQQPPAQLGGARALTCTATGRILVACMPRMALCGGLMMGVPMRLPNVPPLEMVKEPPAMSSMEMESALAFLASSAMASSTCAYDMRSALRSTGTTRPRGLATATLMST